MSRCSLILAICFWTMVPYGTAAAQEPLEAQKGEPPEKIDLLIELPEDDPEYQDCQEDQDAATITGEIIVCRKRSGDENRLYSKEKAERRHAEETAFKKDPKTPDFILDCHDQGWPVGCVKLGSPPPPAYMIDFDELPDAPPGSDADRIARGLAPRGYSAGPDGAVTVAGDSRQQANADILDLPPPRQANVEASEGQADVSPSGSASPVEEPSG